MLKADHNVLQKLLTLFQLGENASLVLLYIFEHGKSAAGTIAEQCSLDRSSTYLTLAQLQKHRLAIKDETTKVATFTVPSPATLQQLIKKKQRALKRITLTIDEQLPSLEKIYHTENTVRPTLRSYTGKQGLEQIVKHILESKEKELLLFSNKEEERELFSNTEHDQFVKGRLKKEMAIRVIMPSSKEAHEMKAQDHNVRRETLILPESKKAFTGELYIYGNNIAMLMFQNEIKGLIATSKEYTEMQRWLFEELWDKYNS